MLKFLYYFKIILKKIIFCSKNKTFFFSAKRLKMQISQKKILKKQTIQNHPPIDHSPVRKTQNLKITQKTSKSSITLKSNEKIIPKEEEKKEIPNKLNHISEQKTLSVFSKNFTTPIAAKSLNNSNIIKTPTNKKPNYFNTKKINSNKLPQISSENKNKSNETTKKKIISAPSQKSNGIITSTEKSIEIIGKTSYSPEYEKTITSSPFNNKPLVNEFQSNINNTLAEKTIQNNKNLLQKQRSKMIDLTNENTQKHDYLAILSPFKNDETDNVKVTSKIQTVCKKKTINLPTELDLFPTFDQMIFQIEIEDILLGKGAFGSVYKIRDKKEEKALAMKIIEVFDEDQKTFIYSNIINEVNIMKKINDLDSKNVLLFEKVFRKPKQNKKLDDILILTELCDCNLQEIIEKRAENSLFYQENELLYYFKELFSALSEIHKAKIAHRDIKPKNILYKSEEFKLKYADFGESKILNEPNANEILNHTIRGTPSFMSPEIFNLYTFHFLYGEYDPYASDYFSLGLCFLMMKTLNTQPKRENLPEILKKLAQSDEISSKLILCLLDENEEKRKEKSLRFLQEVLEKKTTIPNEKEVLALIKLENGNSLDGKEFFSKMYLIALMYYKLSNLKKAKEIVNEILLTSLEKLKAPSMKNFLNALLYKTYFLSGRIENDLEIKGNQRIDKKISDHLGIQQFEKAYQILTTELIYVFSNKIYKNEYGDILNELGISYKNVGYNEEALKYYRKSLDFAIELYGNESYNTAAIYHNIGSIFFEMGILDEAQKYLYDSLKIGKKIRENRQINKESSDIDSILDREYVRSLLSLSQVLIQDQETVEVKDILEEALEISLQDHMNQEIIEIYVQLGNFFLNLREYQNSLNYFEKVVDLVQNDNVLLGENYNNLAIAYAALGDEKKWKNYLNMAIDLANKTNLHSCLALSYFTYGNCFFQSENNEKAEEYFLKSLEIYEKNNMNHENIANLYFNIGVIKMKKIDLKQAKHFLEKSLGFYLDFYQNETNPKILSIKEILRKL